MDYWIEGSVDEWERQSFIYPIIPESIIAPVVFRLWEGVSSLRA